MKASAVGLLCELLSGRPNAQTRPAIFELLAKADAEELNQMLAEPKLTDRLVAVLSTVRFGRSHRGELRDLLGVARRGELDLPARAALVHALQTGHTSRRDELVVRDLFTDVQGVDLTVLKNLIDATPNHNDLEELIYRDIDSDEIRQQILEHIAVQATLVSDLEAKVLSDIDDTTICSLHDRRFPKGLVYPGVVALWEALDLGPDSKPRSFGDLTFITARPADLFGWVEDQTRKKLRGAGVSVSSMLTGSMLHLLSHAGMAEKKIQNINHYHALFPEYRLVFIGDSGQGDVRVAERLLTEFAGSVDAVLIHDVVSTDASSRARCAERGIVFFDTYVGAAIAVRQLGLISEAGLWAVADATLSEFQKVPWRSAEQEAHARQLLDRDLAALPVPPGA
ncbi:MAG: DUF2183 domain-containing protein [Brooklawnia sp.]|nr:DUF2183 domain-containing protein [Brooklawnia sp.]